MRCAGRLLTGRPSSLTSPACAGKSPEITRINVVLPAPFGPITATASPAATASDTANNA